MGSLWIFNIDAEDDDIEDACRAAAAELARRGISAELAQQATLEAMDLPEDFAEDRTPQAAAVVAWYAAEDEAFQRISELTGTWPHDAGLIYTETN